MTDLPLTIGDVTRVGLELHVYCSRCFATRRLARTLTIPADAARLPRYAEELEVQAVDLDRRAKECG